MIVLREMGALDKEAPSRRSPTWCRDSQKVSPSLHSTNSGKTATPPGDEKEL